jgi:hypothetical protein
MIATALQIAGALTVSLGLGLVWLPLGLVAVGTFALLFGLAVERNNAE